MSNMNAGWVQPCCSHHFCPQQAWWLEQEQAQAQEQEQLQLQAQLQAQGQDQDQNLRTIVKDIGNNTINITIDNENILVAVLVLVEALLGEFPEVGALRAYLEQRASHNAQNT